MSGLWACPPPPGPRVHYAPRSTVFSFVCSLLRNLCERTSRPALPSPRAVRAGERRLPAPSSRRPGVLPFWGQLAAAAAPAGARKRRVALASAVEIGQQRDTASRSVRIYHMRAARRSSPCQSELHGERVTQRLLQCCRVHHLCLDAMCHLRNFHVVAPHEGAERCQRVILQSRSLVCTVEWAGEGVRLLGVRRHTGGGGSGGIEDPPPLPPPSARRMPPSAAQLPHPPLRPWPPPRRWLSRPSPAAPQSGARPARIRQPMSFTSLHRPSAPAQPAPQPTPANTRNTHVQHRLLLLRGGLLHVGPLLL